MVDSQSIFNWPFYLSLQPVEDGKGYNMSCFVQHNVHYSAHTCEYYQVDADVRGSQTRVLFFFCFRGLLKHDGDVVGADAVEPSSGRR